MVKPRGLSIWAVLQPVAHVVNQIGHGAPHHYLDFAHRLRHDSRRLFPLLVPNLRRDLPKLVRHAEADVPPTEVEGSPYLLDRRVVERIVKRTQLARSMLAQLRIQIRRASRRPTARPKVV